MAYLQCPEWAGGAMSDPDKYLTNPDIRYNSFCLGFGP